MLVLKLRVDRVPRKGKFKKYVPDKPRNKRNSRSKARSVEQALERGDDEIKIFFDTDFHNNFNVRSRLRWLKERFKEAGVSETGYVFSHHGETKKEKSHLHVFRIPEEVEQKTIV